MQNQFTTTGIIAGALGGLLVTVLVTMLWPKKTLRFLRPIAAAGLGVGAAYLLMTYVK